MTSKSEARERLMNLPWSVAELQTIHVYEGAWGGGYVVEADNGYTPHDVGQYENLTSASEAAEKMAEVAKSDARAKNIVVRNHPAGEIERV